MYSHDHHLSVKCCLHHPNTPFKTTKPLFDQPQPLNSASKSDDDKEDDDRPQIFKSSSGSVVTGKDLAFLKQKLLLPTAGNRACRRPSRYVPYKGTFVPYDGTFGAPDQGQTLDV